MHKKQSILGWVFRITVSLLLLLLHFGVFPLPIVEIFLVYIILFNPRWFRKLLESMAQNDG